MRALIHLLAPTLAFGPLAVFLACSSSGGSGSGDDAGGGGGAPADAVAEVDAPGDAKPKDAKPPRPCATVKCAAGTVCDKEDEKCYPTSTTSRIGGTCAISGKDAVCGTHPDAVCFNQAQDGFPEGYCSVTPCGPDKLCPFGSACAKLGGKPPACYKRCVIDGECRNSDYKCQNVENLFVAGREGNVCYMPAFPCTQDLDCPESFPKCSADKKCRAPM